MGFLVRSPAVSIAFDIVRGLPDKAAPGFTVSTGWVQRLMAQSDVLFISHLHGDHADPAVARLFLEAGKPVIAPEGLWGKMPDLASRLTCPKRSADTVHSVPIQNGKQMLKVVAYPGHQGAALTNNLYLVTTPDGFTVVHTGDQSGAEGPGSDFD